MMGLRRPPVPEFDTAAIEHQLLTGGAFNPLSWLLDKGHLEYTDYERWRRGEEAALDELLHPGADQLLQQLRGLQRHAGKLGLEAQPQCYHVWSGERAGQVLTLSRRPELDQALSQLWTRAESIFQLDLFMDNQLTAVENQLIEQLATRQWNLALDSCDALASLAPEHQWLGGYRRLSAFGERAQLEPEMLRVEWQELFEEIAPLASECLRQQVRDFLAPAWGRLARAMDGQPFDPARPEFHLSHIWAQLPDWSRVSSAILATPDWPQQFVLVQRLARACQHRHPEHAVLLYCHLLQLDEPAASALFDGPLIPVGLHQHWQAFNDLDDDLSPALFPAFVLLRQPGLRHVARDMLIPRFGHDSFQICLELLEQKYLGGDEIVLRQRLKEVSPVLLAAYLRGLNLNSP
jgi:hypothetical protein